MASTRGLDDFPASVIDTYPRHIRDAFRRQARAGAALRLYRRRGWNDSAVSLQYERESANVKRLLLDEAFAYENPSLF